MKSFRNFEYHEPRHHKYIVEALVVNKLERQVSLRNRLVKNIEHLHGKVSPHALRLLLQEANLSDVSYFFQISFSMLVSMASVLPLLKLIR